MDIRVLITLMLLIICTTNVGAEVRALAEFHQYLEQAASVLKAKADLEAQRANLQASTARKGLEVFGSVSAGYQKSPFAREPFGRFFDPAARLGIRYPLLGSAEQQQRAINDAATQVKIEDIRLNWSKRLAGLFLEENYAAYWSAQKILAFNNAYILLRAEGIEKILQKRQEANLLFKSDYLEFLSNFDRAERARIEFSNHQEQALLRLTQLTDTTVLPFESIKPRLDQFLSRPSLEINQPDLDILQVQIDNMAETQNSESWQGIDSDVSASVFGGPAIPYPSSDSPQFGYGGAVAFNFRMPLEIISYRKGEQSRIKNQLSSLKLEHTRRSQEINFEFGDILNRYQQLQQQIKFIQTRLSSANELIRERYLRLHALDGDVLEKYIQAINAYYRIAIEYIEAEAEEWKLHIRLRQYISTQSNAETHNQPDINLDALINPLQQAQQFLSRNSSAQTNTSVAGPDAQKSMTASTHQTSAGFAVYAWDYNKLMTYPRFWEKAHAQKINRILLSLNQYEIDAIKTDPQVLNNFINVAHQQGVQVELLLGDPGWVLSAERHKLLNIIRQLSAVKFDGLHLDIEPDQLEVKLNQDHFKAFIETIRLAKSVSPWPLGISIHPRYLINQDTFDLCIPCQLHEIGVNEVAVMYYSMNIQNIVSALKTAMQKYPNLIFSLAQSLERNLGPENSYAHKPKPLFNDAMRQLRDQLHAPNFGGLIIQSWQDWEAYNHENPL